MNKSSFFIVGQHAVIEALKNPKRKVLRVFLTEESKKNIHRKSPTKNLLDNLIFIPSFLRQFKVLITSSDLKRLNDFDLPIA